MFGGFGNNQNSTFGNQQTNNGFGGSQFTSNTSTGFGSFGQAGQPPQNPTFGTSNFSNTQGFGSTGFNQTASSFNTGASFGAAPTTGFGSSSFGGFGQQQQQQQPTNAFQSSNTFGVSNAPASGFGSMGNTTSVTTNQGTGNPSYVPTQDKESGAILSSMSVFHSISAMPAYKNWSFEELRFADYGLNKKFSGVAAGGGFGTSAFGSSTANTNTFGAANNTQTPAFGGISSTGGFGSFGATTAAPTFGAQTPQTGSVFGAAPTNNSAFGSTTTSFGQSSTATPFGQKPVTSTAWGAQPTNSTFGAPSTGFGSQPTASTSTWGAPAASTGFGMSSTTPAPAFGQPAQPAGGLFGAKPATSAGFSFAPTTSAPAASTSLFGASTSAPLFGAAQQPAPAGGLFGSSTAKPGGFSFGTAASTSAPFGALQSATTTAPSLFGSTPAFGQQAQGGGGLFGTPAVTTQPAAGLFGGTSLQPASTGLFGTSSAPKIGGFGSFPASTPQPVMTGGAFGSGMFGQTPGQTTSLGGGTTLFGASTPAIGRPMAQALTATIDRNPYGVNPLFTPSKAPAEVSLNNSDPVVISVKTTEKKKPILTPHFKVTPRSTSKVKLRGFAGTSPVANQGLSDTKSALKIQPTIVKEQKVVGLDYRFTPRKTMTKLIISETPDASFTPSALSQKNTLKSGTKEVTFDPSLEEVALSSLKEKESVLPSSYDENGSERSTPSKKVSENTVSSLTTPQSIPAKSTDYMIEPPISDLLLLSDEELHAVSGFKVSLEGVGWVKFLQPVDLLQASPTGTRSGISQIPGSIIILEPKICTVYPDEDIKPPCGFGLNVPAEINIEKCWPLDKVTKKPILDESDPRHDRHMQKLEKMPGTKWLGFHNPSGTWRFRVEHFSRYGLIDDDSDEEVDDRLVPQEIRIDDQDNILDVSAIEEEESMAKDSFAYIKDRKALLTEYASSEDDKTSSENYDSAEIAEESEQDSNSSILIESSDDESDSQMMDELDANDQSLESEPSSVNCDNTPRQQPSARSTVQQRELARKVQTMKSSLFSSAQKSKVMASDNSLFGNKPLSFELTESKTFDAAQSSKREQVESSPERPIDTRMDFDLLKNKDGLISSPKKYRRALTQKNSKSVPILEQSVLQGNEKQIVDAAFFMSRSFRVGWFSTCLIRKSAEGYSKLEITTMDSLSCFPADSQCQEQALIQILDKTSISFISILSEDSEEEEEFEGENVAFFVNVNKIPKVSVLKSFNFSCMESAAKCNEIFGKEQWGLWKLASALWDDIRLPVNHESLDEDLQGKIMESLRKERFSSWLKWALNSKAGSLAAEESSIEKIWRFLICRRVDLAIKEALATRNFRLASLLSQMNGPSAAISVKDIRSGVDSDHIFFGGVGSDCAVLEDISAQLRIWSRAAFSHMDDYMVQIWKVLSGNIELWDSKMFVKLYDWKQLFGLYFWYGNGGHLSINHVLELYKILCSAPGHTHFPTPKPEHSPASSGKVLDICFNMIQLFVDEHFPLEEALTPSSFSTEALDYLSPWIIYITLSKVKNVRDFQDVKAVFTEHRPIDNQDDVAYPVITSISCKGDMITFNVINQLEVIGLWKYAIFVSLFLSDHFQRAFTIKTILARNYPMDDGSGSAFDNLNGKISPDWTFLVNQLKIPTNWIHEARALAARYNGRPIQEAVSLFDANLFDSCHSVVISKIVPASIFSGNYSFLRKILSALQSHLINNWELGGNMVLDYLQIIEKVPTLINKAELSLANASVADRSENILSIEELKNVWIGRMTSITIIIKNIKLQHDSIWHDSDISTKSLEFLTEKLEGLLLDCSHILGEGEQIMDHANSGVHSVISDSKEWFLSILSV